MNDGDLEELESFAQFIHQLYIEEEALCDHYGYDRNGNAGPLNDRCGKLLEEIRRSHTRTLALRAQIDEASRVFDVEPEKASKSPESEAQSPGVSRASNESSRGDDPKQQKATKESEDQNGENGYGIEASLMLPLTNAEFGLVPSYMKGRLQRASVNSFIDQVNDVIRKKYALLALADGSAATRRKFNKLPPVQRDLISRYKSEETDASVGKLFCTERDVLEVVKNQQTVKKLMPILRHVKRCKEVREKGLVRIVLLPQLTYG